MHNQAFPRSQDAALRLGIDASAYAAAREHFSAGRFRDALAQARQALQKATAPEAPDTTSAPDADRPGPSVRDAAILVAWSLHQLRRYESCRQWFVQAVADGFLSGEDPEAALIELWIRWSEGHYADVVAQAERHLADYSGQLHPLLGEFLFLRGSAYSRLGEYAGAAEDCSLAHSIFKILGKQKEQGEAANALGVVLIQSARYAEALEWLAESLKINRALGLVGRIADNNLNMGIAYYRKGDYGTARQCLLRAQKSQRDQGSPNLICRIKIALGNVCRLQRDFHGARRNLMAAYSLATERHLAREECLALEFLGDVFRDEGNPDEARRYYARGLAIARDIAPRSDLVAELLRRDGECLEMLDCMDEAVIVLRQAQTLAARLGDRCEEAAVLRALAAALGRQGLLAEARDDLDRALWLLRDTHAPLEKALTHLRYARIVNTQAAAKSQPHGRSALLAEALKHALLAQQIFGELQLEFWQEESDRLVTKLTWYHLEGAASVPASTPAGLPIFLPGAPTSETVVIAVSDAMRAALQRCHAYAGYEEPVLITGETGTGKDLIARRIHELSARRARPFVAVNCAAIPATLFEREFFGHHRGAYTGADQSKTGFVAEAEGGTLFLDEIGELPLEQQPKLLRLLQDGTFTRLGDPSPCQADVRLLAATNSDLDRLVTEGRFRQDLNYRLKVLQIDLAPLRARPDDILPLLEHYLTHFAGRPATVWSYFDHESVRTLRQYDWPGNVREVMMVARRAHISLESEGLTQVQLGNGSGNVLLAGPGRGGGNADPITRDRILQVLQQTGGSKAEAARQLGVARQTLYRWLKKHGIAV